MTRSDEMQNFSDFTNAIAIVKASGAAGLFLIAETCKDCTTLAIIIVGLVLIRRYLTLLVSSQNNAIS